MIYVVVFLGSLAVDLIPIVAPPAWTLMALLLVKYRLNLWLVVAVGVAGSALGRYLFSLYITEVSDKFLARRKKEELQYVGENPQATLADVAVRSSIRYRRCRPLRSSPPPQ